MRGSVVLTVLSSVVVLAACSQSSMPTVPSSVSPSAAANGPATPATVPLNGQFEGTQTVTPLAPPLAQVDANVTGQATLLGRFEMGLPHIVNFATSSAQGTATLTAANGDVITADFTGQAQVGPIVSIVEQATIIGGTGRFDGATGSFTIRRQFNPAAGVTTGTLEGSVTMARGAGH